MRNGAQSRSGGSRLQLRMHLLRELRHRHGEHLPQLWRQATASGEGVSGMATRADLVIVGAGTIGGWAAYFARTSGAERVIVIEQGRVGDGASSRAAGMVRAQG